MTPAAIAVPVHQERLLKFTNCRVAWKAATEASSVSSTPSNFSMFGRCMAKRASASVAPKLPRPSNASGDQKTAGFRLWEVVHWSKANFYFQALAFSTMAINDAKLNHIQAAVTHYNAAMHSLEKGRLSFEREEFKFRIRWTPKLSTPNTSIF
jgi:hypothetical protein